MFMLRANERVWGAYKKMTQRISSTEMSSVLDCNTRTSRKKLWEQKKGIITRKDLGELLPIQHGRNQEPIAREKIYEILKEHWELKLPKTVFDPEEPVCCSPDGVFYHREQDAVMGLEIKCPWLAENVPLTKEKIKLEYLIQCFVCLMVLRADSWLLVYYDATGGVGLTGYQVFPDSRLWTECFLPEVDRFQADLEGTKPCCLPRAEKKKKKDWVREKLLELTVPCVLSMFTQ